MRVIAGKLKGRVIHETHGHKTHPMSEKIRGALFNVLGDVEGLTLLDAFTGTGAVAVEALSRGMTEVVALDMDAEAFKTAQKNVGELSQHKTEVLRVNVKSWSSRNKDRQFDVVIVDMPFDEVNDRMLERLHKHIKKSGILVLCLPSDYKPRPNDVLTLISQKSYGDAKLEFFRKLA